MRFTTILWITGGFAGLCVGGLPLWLLGIPGVEGTYARGWKQGLSTLFLYPVLWLIGGAPYFLMRGRWDDLTRARWQNGTAVAFIVFFLAAVASLMLAFRTMRFESKDVQKQK